MPAEHQCFSSEVTAIYAARGGGIRRVLFEINGYNHVMMSRVQTPNWTPHNKALAAGISRLLASFPGPLRSAATAKMETANTALARQQTSQSLRQLLHVYRELLFGAYLLSKGFLAEYESQVGTKTPDWFDRTAGILFDVVTSDAPADVQESLWRLEACCIWPQSVERLGDSLKGKIPRYHQVVRNHNLKYVVAVYGASENCPEISDCAEAIKQWDFATLNPYVSGFAFFMSGLTPDLRSGYLFHYFPNATAERPLSEDEAQRLTGSLQTP